MNDTLRPVRKFIHLLAIDCDDAVDQIYLYIVLYGDLVRRIISVGLNKFSSPRLVQFLCVSLVEPNAFIVCIIIRLVKTTH